MSGKKLNAIKEKFVVGRHEDTVNKQEVKVADWKFDSVVEFESQLDTRLHAAGVRLFHFASISKAISAYVLFTGAGVGGGFKFKLDNQAVRIALETIEGFARPSVGLQAKINLPRQKASALTLERLTMRLPFSLRDLDGANGKLSAAGAGLGIGVGGFVASAEKSGETLFSCQKLGVEFGRIGGNATVLQGSWLVACTWDD